MMIQKLPVNQIRTYTLICLILSTLFSVCSCSGSYNDKTSVMKTVFSTKNITMITELKRLVPYFVNHLETEQFLFLQRNTSYFANLNAKYFEEITGQADI
jgi:hypothetical protein